MCIELEQTNRQCLMLRLQGLYRAYSVLHHVEVREIGGGGGGGAGDREGEREEGGGEREGEREEGRGERERGRERGGGRRERERERRGEERELSKGVCVHQTVR